MPTTSSSISSRLDSSSAAIRARSSRDNRSASASKSSVDIVVSLAFWSSGSDQRLRFSREPRGADAATLQSVSRGVSAAAACQPAFRRPPRTRRGGTASMTVSRSTSRIQRDVLIERGPVNTDTRPDQLPTLSFGGRPVCKPRVPIQWDGYRPAVVQVHHQRPCRDPHVLGHRCISCRL